MSKAPKAKTSAIPADRLALYDAMIAAVPGVERKGAANAYTSVNGNMYSYMNPDGVLALKLAPGEREAFIARYGAKLHEAYGIVQKDYVTVPAAVLADTGLMATYFQASHTYALTLKPKPTTKPKRA
jgi:hypothetical protein